MVRFDRGGGVVTLQVNSQDVFEIFAHHSCDFLRSNIPEGKTKK